MIQIYVRHKTQNKKIQGEQFTKSRRDFYRLFEDRSFSRKRFHARRFLRCFTQPPKHFLKIVRDTKYFSNILQKRNICKGVENFYEVQLLCQPTIMSSFYQFFSNIHFPSRCLFLERVVDFTISFYYNKNVGSPFFVKFFFQNQSAGTFP